MRLRAKFFRIPHSPLIPSEFSEKRMSDFPILIPSGFKGMTITDFEIWFSVLIEMFVTSISFRRTFKSFWDPTGKSAILVKSALLWISQPKFQNQSIERKIGWKPNQKKKARYWALSRQPLRIERTPTSTQPSPLTPAHTQPPHALAKYTKEPWLYPPPPLNKERSSVGRAQAPHRLVSRWCPFSIHSSNGVGCIVSIYVWRDVCDT